MKKILLILSLFIFQTGYSELNLDSLWGVYNNEQESDSTRLYTLWNIAFDGYLYNNPDSCVQLAQEMYVFAVKTGQLQFQGYALGTKGSAYYYMGKHELAITHQKKALEIHKKLKNISAMGSVYNNIATVYREKGQQAEALNYFMKALKIYEKLDKKQAISTVLGNLGAVYEDMKDHERSKMWYRKALAVKKQTNDHFGLSLLYAGIGTRYLNEGIYDSAMYFQTKGLEIRKKIENKNGIAFSTKYVGEIYFAQGYLDSALVFYFDALPRFEKLKMESGITDVCLDIALVYQKKKDYEKAMRFGKRSLEVANKGGFLDAQRDGSFILYELYKQKGNQIKALKMHEDFIALRDSMNKEANQKAIIQQEVQYNYDKKTIADSLQHVEEKKLENFKHEQKSEKQQIVITAIGGGLALVILFLIFVFNRLRVTRKQKKIIEEQKEVVEEKNQEIVDSITYAKRIQSAILPPLKVVKEYLAESFILYKPKDIVAGDFYWLESKEDKVLFAAADCTGHGVPGAMVSVVCNNALNRSVREYGLTDPGEILTKTREIVIQEFEKSDEEVKDGMDIALCSLEGNKLAFAGAHNPLWIIRDGAIIETKADKQPIGKFDNPIPYTTHHFELNKGDSIYIFSDGYVDQFGGEKGKKFKSKSFKELLLSIQNQTMEDQKESINSAFENWKGSLDQIDDVCVIGVRI